MPDLLLLYGFNDPESEILMQGLLEENIAIATLHYDEVQDYSDLNIPNDTVALVWCIGKTTAHAVSISNKIASAGTPVVAIMEKPVTRGFDFYAGFIELCFNPHSVHEVAARINTVQARSNIKTRTIIVQGNLSIDIHSFAVTLNGKNIELTYKEYELLKLFASNPGRVFRREEILNRIWGDDYYGGTRTVDVHVRRLRSKLEDLSHTIIETMWRVGYRFSAPERTSTNATPAHRISHSEA